MKPVIRFRTLLFAVLLAAAASVPASGAGHSLTFECADPSGAPTTLCDVYLNPDIHHGSFGTVLFHATSAGKHTITVPDGKIAIRASAKGSTGTNTSVLVVTIPSTCQAGWARLGYQSWWSDTGQDPAFESRHAHIDDLCVPANNLIVNGPQTFAFGLQLHNQPRGAKLTRVRVKDYCSGSGCAMGAHSSGYDVWVSRTDLPQPDSAGNLAYPVSVPLDLSKMKAGRHELRFGVYVTQPNGKVQLLSSRTEVCVRACSPSYRSLSTYPLLQGNGAWYDRDSIGYVDARVRSALP